MTSAGRDVTGRSSRKKGEPLFIRVQLDVDPEDRQGLVRTLEKLRARLVAEANLWLAEEQFNRSTEAK